jgi:peptidoglycan/LPS O-acetylase OafA/YrhL
VMARLPKPSLLNSRRRQDAETAMSTQAILATAERGGGLAARIPSEFRPEIQGLRAVAVLLVVLFHLWPNRLPGGFVGVDVFFVISGYLITAHMYREAATTGTLSLRRFWARRIRRLLPASLLVLAISAAAAVLFLPATVWMMTARQIAASALYVQNWALAEDAVDYMAKDNVPTLAQHYWSLSVEEQFYVFWPLLVLGLIFLAGRPAWRRRVGLRRLLIVGFCGAGATSLAWSVLATANERSTAYFVTPTRVWEFVAGALVAVVVIPGMGSEKARRTVGWLGLGAIVTSAVLIDGESLFPGWIALLPVLGTVAVIVAGATVSHYTPAWWLSRRPLVFIGDISYSVYLWHWPLIIVFPHVTGVDLRTLDKISIFVATIILSWLSKIFVEDPMRTKPLLVVRPWRSFAFAAAGMTVVVAVSVVIIEEVERRADAAVVAAEQGSSDATGINCDGPQALDPGNGCASVAGSGPLVPPPEVVALQNAEPAFPGCQQTIAPSAVKICAIGSDDPHPERIVAVVGDSHATHWFAAFDRLGQTRNWKVLTYVKTSCPVMTARRVLPDEQTDDGELSCLAWGETVRRQIAADESISYVFTAAFSSAYDYTDAPGRPSDDPRTDGFQAVWKTWVAAGKEVFVIKDVPPTQGDNVPNCLAGNLDDRLACATSADELPVDASEDAAVAMGDPLVHLIDLTDQFCDSRLCYPVVGDLIVYRDYSHLSGEYSQALAPYISEQVDQLADAR